MIFGPEFLVRRPTQKLLPNGL